MPCLQSVLRWLMDRPDPSWPCYSYQWASCREPQGFCHTDTFTSPSQVSCCKCFPLKLQLLYLACPQYSCFVHLWCCISKWVALSGLSCYHTTKKWNKRALPVSKSVFMISLICCCFISDLGYYKFIYKILSACLMLGLGKQEIHSQSFLSQLWTQDSMTWCSKCRAPHAIESSGQCRANVSCCPKHRLRNRALKSVMSPTTMKRKSFLNQEKTQVEQVLTQKHKLFLAGLAGVLISYRHQGQLASDPRVFPSHTPSLSQPHCSPLLAAIQVNLFILPSHHW